MEPWTTVAAVAAGIAGMLYLLNLARKGFRTIEALNALVQHELTPNSGKSVVDRIERIETHMGDMCRRVEGIERRIQ